MTVACVGCDRFCLKNGRMRPVLGCVWCGCDAGGCMQRMRRQIRWAIEGGQRPSKCGGIRSRVASYLHIRCIKRLLVCDSEPCIPILCSLLSAVGYYTTSHVLSRLVAHTSAQHIKAAQTTSSLSWPLTPRCKARQNPFPSFWGAALQSRATGPEWRRRVPVIKRARGSQHYTCRSIQNRKSGTRDERLDVSLF